MEPINQQTHQVYHTVPTTYIYAGFLFPVMVTLGIQQEHLIGSHLYLTLWRFLDLLWELLETGHA
jgi:hypothetical protein